jgi:molybdopterin-guanine dinucleotide biosynthesis protein A
VNGPAILWSAAILAGGRARRFGGLDKADLVVDGRSILDRQLALLLAATDDVLIVGGAVRQVPGGVRQVADRHPGLGPLAGLDAALTHAVHDTVIVLACDMPYVTGGLLHHLASLAQNVDIVVPESDRGYHPLCAAYTRACHEAVARRLAEHRLSLTGLFEEVRVRVVPAGELRAFGDARRLMTNLNTPDDLAALAAPWSHQG